MGGGLPVNAKAKGTRNEYKSIRLFEAAGYRCMRSAGSIGTFDFIAIGSTDVVLCQVKSNEWPPRLEMDAIREYVIPKLFVRKVVHRWRDRARDPDVRVIE